MRSSRRAAPAALVSLNLVVPGRDPQCPVDVNTVENSEIEVQRKSHLSAYSVVYVGSCHSNAY
jgi:hypothetical protein